MKIPCCPPVRQAAQAAPAAVNDFTDDDVHGRLLRNSPQMTTGKPSHAVHDTEHDILPPPSCPTCTNWGHLLSMYNRLCRLRLAYAFCATFAVISAFALAGSIQIGFALVVESFDDKQNFNDGRRSFFVLLMYVFLPCSFWFGSVLVDQLSDLILDAMDRPPCLRLRAMMIELGFSHAMADTFVILAIEIWPLVGTVVTLAVAFDSTFTFQAFVFDHGLGLAHGAIVVCSLVGLAYSCVQTGYLFFVASSKKPPILPSTMGRLSKFMLGEVFSLNPDRRVMQAEAYSDGQLVSLTHDSREIHAYYSTHRPKLGAACCLIALVGFILCGLVCQYDLDQGFLCKAYLYLIRLFTRLAFMIAMIMGSRLIVPGLLGPVFYIMLVAYIFFSVVLTSAAASIAYTDFGYTSLFDSAIGLYNNASFYQADVRNGYPICLLRWGSLEVEDSQRLSVLDMSTFAAAMYTWRNSEEVDAQVKVAFANTSLDEPVLDRPMGGRWRTHRWASWTVPGSRTRILAIRGTETSVEVAVDVEIYSLVLVIEYLNFFAPISNFIPRDGMRWLIKQLTWTSDFDGSPWDQLIEDAKFLKELSDMQGYELVITGHSLGGVMAMIAGARIGAQSVAFSPPGLSYVGARFHVDSAAVQSTSTLIQPHRDPVAMVDEQLGMVQHIRCGQSAAYCHSITITRCVLFDECGDARGRRMQEMCAAAGEPIRVAAVAAPG